MPFAPELQTNALLLSFRVVNADGSTGKYAHNNLNDVKKWLLEHEKNAGANVEM